MADMWAVILDIALFVRI